ncbi:MAG: glycosyltransferase family 39 protein [Bacteroidia bacterium]|nr:glycosyltransferase family 39 protein [Bacteroidia bacterium]
MRSAIWIGGAISLFLLLGVMILPFQTILRSVVLDDTFYYAKIAMNFSLSGKFSFDGHNSTNGFHPLWMILMIPIAYLFHDKEVFIRSVLGLKAIFSGSAMGILWLLLRRVADKTTSAISLGVMMVLYYANWILINGMEGGLVIFLLFSVLFVYEKVIQNPHLKNGLLLGLLLDLLILSRLDAALLGVGIGLGYLLGGQGSMSRRLSFLVGVGLIACIFPIGYLLLNWVYFGHPLPVHALVKAGGGNLMENMNRFLSALERFVSITSGVVGFIIIGIAFILFILFAYFLFASRLPKEKNHRKAEYIFYSPLSIPIIISSILHFLVIVFFVGKVYPWHLFLEILGIGWCILIMGCFLERWGRWAKYSFLGTVVIALFIFWGGILYRRWYPTWRELHMAMYEGALWMRAHMPLGVKIGSFDAGIVGYFSDRNVINLDGLVNSTSYLPYVLGDSVHVYVKKEKISYLAQFFREDIYQDGRLPGPPEVWRELIKDTLYVKKFRYMSSGIFTGGIQEMQGYFMVLRLNV